MKRLSLYNSKRSISGIDCQQTVLWYNILKLLLVIIVRSYERRFVLQ